MNQSVAVVYSRLVVRVLTLSLGKSGRKPKFELSMP